MADNGIKYQYQTLKVIRGLEARKIAEMERQGWDVDKQIPGRLRTEITFRRESPAVPWKLIGGLGAVVVVGIAIFGIFAALGADNDGSDQATDKPTASVSATGKSSSSPSKSPYETPSQSPTPTQARVAELLTVKNSPDLKAMLEADDDYSLNAAFAKDHKGEKIQFDGSVADATPGYVLVYYGDGSDTNATSGPAFQFRVRSLQVSGGRTADTGDNLRFVATVGAFNSDQGLFVLAPVKVVAR